MRSIRRLGLGLFVLALTILVLPAMAQNSAEYQGEVIAPDTSIHKATPKTIVGSGIGSYVGWVATNTSGAYPVGLEHDGHGNFYLTDIADIAMYHTALDGSVIGGWYLAWYGNPIGITTDGVYIYITDTYWTSVEIYTLSGGYVGWFSVGSHTWFPEGVTYCPNNDHLYVVSGDGWDVVIEYQKDGTAVAFYPINGYSPDGIAWDPMRQCFWIYDSGTDTVRQYDTSFVQIDSFPGTANAGFSNGEGLAVIGNSLYVVATLSNAIVEFDITFAIGSFDMCIQSQDGTRSFSFSTEGGQFQYCDDTMKIKGFASISFAGSQVMINGISEEGHIVFATADTGPSKTGNVVIRMNRDVAFGEMSPFIKDGIVHMYECPCF